jgi:hypothetical protein
MCCTLGNAKYKGYCVRCFQYYFPDEKVSKNYRIKEAAWGDYIKEVFSDQSWIFNKTVINGMSQYRPDAYLDLGTHVVVLECDEHQHRGYNCINKRRMALMQDFGFRPIVFLLFNPDAYKTQDGKSIPSCWGEDKNGRARVKPSKQNEWEYRLNQYGECVDYYIRTIPQKEVTVESLFYDETD